MRGPVGGRATRRARPRSRRYARWSGGRSWGNRFSGACGTLKVWDNDKQNRGEALGRAHRDLPGPDVFTIGYVRPNTTGPNGGEISGAGDVDWYAVWLSDATVRITLDGMPGFGQPLNDLAGKIQFSVHKRNQSLGGKSTTENDRDATATASPGSQIVELTYTPPSVPGPGIYWIAVSARDGATGRYKLAVNNA